MQIIQIRSKTESIDGSFDILLDMVRWIGNWTISPDDIETAFRGNWQQLVRISIQREGEEPTEDFIPNIMFPDEITQKLFIYTGLIDNLSVSTQTAPDDSVVFFAANSPQYPRKYTPTQ